MPGMSGHELLESVTISPRDWALRENSSISKRTRVVEPDALSTPSPPATALAETAWAVALIWPAVDSIAPAVLDT